MLLVLFVAAAIAAASMTIAYTKIFEPVRDYVARQVGPDWNGQLALFVSKLISCPYCLSHWLSLLASALIPATHVAPMTFPFLEWLVTGLALTGVASIWAYIIEKAYFN